ncbi:MAG TPA: antibiotic biosynthesis monooxygenase [Acidobacteriaceae bacterium]|jgi:heme-degrading monooxygenase HmoA|nr:antibiotic biosynthesis monooxygenase [Acidobacteriaceae bacterium]
MVLEVAILDVRQDRQDAFEANFRLAAPLLAGSPGYISHQLQHCIENPSRYLLLVSWRTLEDHTIGFRQSPQFEAWKELLHHFYDPPPTVQHYRSS